MSVFETDPFSSSMISSKLFVFNCDSVLIQKTFPSNAISQQLSSQFTSGEAKHTGNVARNDFRRRQGLVGLHVPQLRLLGLT